ncbi:MAG: DUF4388 domain-containing protein [Candidatus Eisenbacteria bacterium]
MNALSGALAHFLPIHVLRLLQMAGATGRLEIHNGEERADLFLFQGRSAFAFTNAVHLRVGDVLVSGGDIRPEAIELTLAVQQDQPGERLGAMLVESGVVEPARLRAAVLEVQRRIICRVLLWEEGEFSFHPGEHARDEDITLDLDLDRMIVDAMRVAAVGVDAQSDELAA